MRRLHAWLAGLIGGAAVYRALKRQPPTAAVADPADPAAELKAKLAEARAEPDEVEAVEGVEAVDPAVEARRRAVHERGRAAIDEMRDDYY
jgi:hypothetical protein